MSERNENKAPICSFHKGEIRGPAIEIHDQVLVDGQKKMEVRHLCADCVVHSFNRLKETGRLAAYGHPTALSIEHIKSISPKTLKECLDMRVIAQDEAKITLATALVKHIQRIKNKDSLQRKTNVFIHGPTGTGKTELISTLGKVSGLPVTEVDVSQITPAGIKGDSVEDIIRRHYINSNQNVQLAENGIIYLDEIDKVLRMDSENSLFGNDIQKSLLKCIQGGDFEIRLAPQHQPVNISTRNMMFIVSGAFVGLEKTVGKEKSLGFCSDIDPKKDENWQEKIGAEEFIKYGLMPEFVGRFNSFSYTRELNREQIKRILTEPEDNLVDYYVNLFGGAGANLVLEESFLDYVVEKSLNEKTGVRSLDTKLSSALDPIFYNIDQLVGKTIVVSENGRYSVRSLDGAGILLNQEELTA